MEVFDIMLDANKDLAVVNGDFVRDESTAQHIGLLLESEKSDWRASPISGVGIRGSISDDGSLLQLQGSIQEELERDGMTVIALKIDSQIRIKAEYK